MMLVDLTNLCIALEDKALKYFLVDLQLTYFQSNVWSPKPILVLHYLSYGVERVSLQYLLQDKMTSVYFRVQSLVPGIIMIVTSLCVQISVQVCED